MTEVRLRGTRSSLLYRLSTHPRGRVGLIIVAVFTTLFLNLGVDNWFSQRVSTAVNDSLLVAQTYLQEHQQRLGDEALAMANDLQREGPVLSINRGRFELRGRHARRNRGIVNFDDRGQVCFARVANLHLFCSDGL